jgi:phosphatidylglycerol:prolipoprotein diacylglycerol transferase
MRVESGLLVLAGGVAGARLGFVALHLTYFSAHSIEVTWLWQGGLSWVGGAVGAVIGAAMAAIFTGTSPWDLADALSVPAAIVALAAWTGCLVEACAFGRPVPEAAWAPAAYNSLGVLAPRWPTQALGMILSAVLLAALLRWTGGRRPAGLIGAGTLAAVAATNTILSLTRGDPTMLIGNLRVDTVAGLAVFVGAAGVAIFRIRQPAG